MACISLGVPFLPTLDVTKGYQFVKDHPESLINIKCMLRKSPTFNYLGEVPPLKQINPSFTTSESEPLCDKDPSDSQGIFF